MNLAATQWYVGERMVATRLISSFFQMQDNEGVQRRSTAAACRVIGINEGDIQLVIVLAPLQRLLHSHAHLRLLRHRGEFGNKFCDGHWLLREFLRRCSCSGNRKIVRGCDSASGE